MVTVITPETVSSYDYNSSRIHRIDHNLSLNFTFNFSSKFWQQLITLTFSSSLASQVLLTSPTFSFPFDSFSPLPPSSCASFCMMSLKFSSFLASCIMTGSMVLSFCWYCSSNFLREYSQLFLYYSKVFWNYDISPSYLFCMLLKDSISSSSTFTRLQASCSSCTSEAFLEVFDRSQLAYSTSFLKASSSVLSASIVWAIQLICWLWYSLCPLSWLNSSMDSVSSVLTLISSYSDCLSKLFSSSNSQIRSRSQSSSFSLVKLYQNFLDINQQDSNKVYKIAKGSKEPMFRYVLDDMMDGIRQGRF